MIIEKIVIATSIPICWWLKIPIFYDKRIKKKPGPAVSPRSGPWTAPSPGCPVLPSHDLSCSTMSRRPSRQTLRKVKRKLKWPIPWKLMKHFCDFLWFSMFQPPWKIRETTNSCGSQLGKWIFDQREGGNRKQNVSIRKVDWSITELKFG